MPVKTNVYAGFRLAFLRLWLWTAWIALPLPPYPDLSKMAMIRHDRLPADASPVSVSQKGLIRLSGPARANPLDVLHVSSLQAGAYVSHFKGRGMEFDESRPYQPGDAQVETCDALHCQVSKCRRRCTIIQ